MYEDRGTRPSRIGSPWFQRMASLQLKHNNLFSIYAFKYHLRPFLEAACVAELTRLDTKVVLIGELRVGICRHRPRAAVQVPRRHLGAAVPRGARRIPVRPRDRRRRRARVERGHCR